MSDTDAYILKHIKSWVWSGFYSPADVDFMIGDLLDEGADEQFLRGAVAPEFEKKTQAEATWPKQTDCDRLDAAFDELRANGIVALHNAGSTMSDGVGEVAEFLRQHGRKGFNGYCFYHGQDLERAVAGVGLWIAFGDIDNKPEKKAPIGKRVKETLERHGFAVEWNGDAETRLSIPKIGWKRRYRKP